MRIYACIGKNVTLGSAMQLYTETTLSSCFRSFRLLYIHEIRELATTPII